MCTTAHTVIFLLLFVQIRLNIPELAFVRRNNKTSNLMLPQLAILAFPPLLTSSIYNISLPILFASIFITNLATNLGGDPTLRGGEVK